MLLLLLLLCSIRLLGFLVYYFVYNCTCLHFLNSFFVLFMAFTVDSKARISLHRETCFLTEYMTIHTLSLNLNGTNVQQAESYFKL